MVNSPVCFFSPLKTIIWQCDFMFWSPHAVPHGYNTQGKSTSVRCSREAYDHNYYISVCTLNSRARAINSGLHSPKPSCKQFATEWYISVCIIIARVAYTKNSTSPDLELGGVLDRLLANHNRSVPSKTPGWRVALILYNFEFDALNSRIVQAFIRRDAPFALTLIILYGGD